MITGMRKRTREVDLYAGKHPVDIPTYSFTDAARYLGIPVSTLRSWVLGQRYRTKSGDGFFKPLIELEEQDTAPRLLTFTNLVEAHVLDAVRRVHNISMNKVRETLEFVLERYGTRHPLAQLEFQTDGVDLFLQELGTLVATSAQGQTVMREMLGTYLKRVEWDEEGVAHRLYPFTRESRSPDEPRYVVIDPRISFGRPVLAGTGIPVDILVERFHAGESTASLADDYSCEVFLIEEALRCAISKAA